MKCSFRGLLFIALLLSNVSCADTPLAPSRIIGAGTGSAALVSPQRDRRHARSSTPTRRLSGLGSCRSAMLCTT
jgi:hypothetical protein